MSHDIDNEMIGRKIACLRHAKGYTQDELAEKVNISPSYIAKIESACVGKVSVGILYKIAITLGVTIDDLVDSNKKITIV